jgi:DNA-binding transcriptional MerR regulator
MLNQKETANFLNISVYTLDDWVKKGILIPFKTNGGHRRYKQEDLIKILENKKNIFVKKIKTKHGLNENWFCKTNFIDNETPIKITCPKHGDIENVPSYFLKDKFPCEDCNEFDKKQKRLNSQLEKEKKYCGMIYGMKKIINYIGGNKSLWRTECTNCKFTFDLPLDYIKKNIDTKCYNCRDTKKGELGAMFCYKNYLKTAKKRSIKFELTFEEFVIITSKNCFYCGDVPKYDKKMQQEYTKYAYNGIDRTDNEIGYIVDNCVPCCKTCNSLKLDRTLDEFKKHIERIVIHRKNQGFNNE